MLERTGLTEAADEASKQLPDPVSEEDVGNWAGEHGITKDVLISQMGGSP
jgi:hypothetical protein